MRTIAHVLVNVPVKTIDQAYTYLTPTKLSYLTAGWRVWVPFGGRTAEGFVVAVEEAADGAYEAGALKEVIGCVDDFPWFDDQMLAAARWISRYYVCSLAEAMRLFMPGKSGLRIQKRAGGTYEIAKKTTEKYETVLRLNVPAQDAPALLASLARKPAQRRLAEALMEAGELGRAAVRRMGIADDAVRRALDSGVAAARRRRVYRDSYRGFDAGAAPPPAALNGDQAAALAALGPALAARRYRPFLLHGVTGSGKTEVYIEAAAVARAQGRQVMALVPEIALTGQIVRRFRARFGDDVVVMHSKLSLNERGDAIGRLRRGEAGIVIGARSAVFAPLSALGLLVMDEEHDSSYKQEETPRYHTRSVAQKRARLAGAVLLLGSATPAIETYYHARQGALTLLALPGRADGAALPAVELVDMREELKRGRRSILSAALERLIAAAAARGEQTIILLNRRGFSTFVMCRECGHVVTCDHCAVPLVYHKTGGLRCHYCRAARATPDVCPACGSRYIRYFGTGTQRVEDELARLFPALTVARMDQDTTGGKMAHERILRDFAAHRSDILLGTQMVAKGHDVKNVTAVGVISADSALNLPDFRAAERTFAILTQAAGRAGRGGAPGKVVIQTYNPEHYAVVCGARHDYAAFYQQEIEFRRQLFYPPFGRIVKITILDTLERETARKAEAVAAALRKAGAALPPPFAVLGPFAAPVARIKDVYRTHILVKTAAVEQIRPALLELGLHRRQDVVLDVDPVNVM